jgi:hypothetical protein
VVTPTTIAFSVADGAQVVFDSDSDGLGAAAWVTAMVLDTSPARRVIVAVRFGPVFA